MQLREAAVPIRATRDAANSFSAAGTPSRDDTTILVQGGSLRTWSYRSPSVEQVQVVLSTEGRPLDADIELWHGPDNTPVKMRVYCENGQLRPFSAVIETPRGPNTVAIRNIGQIEFPIAANVVADEVDLPSPEARSARTPSTRPSTASRSSSRLTAGRSTPGSSSFRAPTTTSRSSSFTPRTAATGHSSASSRPPEPATWFASSTRARSSSP